MTWFIASAIVATLLAVALIIVPLYRAPAGSAPLTAVLTALLLPLTVALLYAMTSTYPWLEQAGVAAADGGTAEILDSKLIIEIKNFLDTNPRDANAWNRLGDAYLEESRFAEAREAYRRTLELKGGSDDELQLAFAEAAILADRSSLLGEAGRMVDDVLGRSPSNPKALWYGGMAALGRGENDLARQRWSRLLDLSPPPQVREVIEQQLAQLGGLAAGQASPGESRPAAVARIPVRITVKPELASRIEPGATFSSREAPAAAVRRSPSSVAMQLLFPWSSKSAMRTAWFRVGPWRGCQRFA
jgi:cytochrome c-type biogenesis protein CcmH